MDILQAIKKVLGTDTEKADTAKQATGVSISNNPGTAVNKNTDQAPAQTPSRSPDIPVTTSDRSVSSKSGRISSSKLVKTGGSYQDPTLVAVSPISNPPEFIQPQNRNPFANNPLAGATLQSLLSHPVIPKSPLQDNNPYRVTSRVADDFVTKSEDFTRTRDRSNLTPLLALADYWTGGKSHLADTYKPPTSRDDMQRAMMELGTRSRAEQDNAENAAQKNYIDAYKDTQITPQVAAINAFGTAATGQAKNENEFAKAVAGFLTSIKNTNDTNAVNLYRNLNDNRTRVSNDRARDEAAHAVLRDSNSWSESYNNAKSQMSPAMLKGLAAQEDTGRRAIVGQLTGRNVPIKDADWTKTQARWAPIVDNLINDTVNKKGLLQLHGNDPVAARQHAIEMIRANWHPSQGFLDADMSNYMRTNYGDAYLGTFQGKRN